MKYRVLGNTGIPVSEISMGTWQLGGKWGDTYNARTARATLESAYENGITFFDTADVYNDGLSEKSIGEFLKGKEGKVTVATKCGRQLSPHVASGYTCEAIWKFVDESLLRLDVEALDLLQLHCPPTDVFYRPEIFECLRTLKRSGKIRYFGVSVERIEEGLKAMEYEGLSSVQVIFNMFRQRPAELLLPRAKEKNIGIICRVPLASGLLTGKFTLQSVFGKEDHRNYNRNGASFDKGETFSGVDYQVGLEAVEELKKVFPQQNLVDVALKWILMHEEVSCVITGASRPEQIVRNTRSSEAADLTEEQLQAVVDVYNHYIRNPVHDLW